MHRTTLTLCLSLVVAVLTGHASSIVQRTNLVELTGNAERIFYGRCLAAQPGKDANGLPCTVYTFEVERSLKGKARPQVQIKQFGTTRALADGNVTRIEGMPDYTVGQSYLLFLTPESELGFTSPQGLGQGAFRAFRDPETGRMAVENEMQNRSLLENLRRESGGRPLRSQLSGVDEPLFLDDLILTITRLLNKN